MTHYPAGVPLLEHILVQIWTLGTIAPQNHEDKESMGIAPVLNFNDITRSSMVVNF